MDPQQVNEGMPMSYPQAPMQHPPMQQPFYQPSGTLPLPIQQDIYKKWLAQFNNLDSVKNFKSHELPLARIKKIMKSDEDVKMISAEAPILFAKACEMFIVELTLRAWVHTEESKRRTLQRNDIATAISKTDIFDFLIDIVPREDGKPPKKDLTRPPGSVPEQYQQQYMFLLQQQAFQQQAAQQVHAQQAAGQQNEAQTVEEGAQEQANEPGPEAHSHGQMDAYYMHLHPGFHQLVLQQHGANMLTAQQQMLHGDPSAAEPQDVAAQQNMYQHMIAQQQQQYQQYHSQFPQQAAQEAQQGQYEEEDDDGDE